MKKAPTTFIDAGMFESGIGQVVIARYKGGDRVELGVFLVDVFCLGVKNAFFTQCHETELEGMLQRLFKGSRAMEEHTGAWGRKLMEGALEYARKLGFAPHRNYKKAARVMGGIDPNTCPETFVFGKEGKPMFVAGPHENAARCQLIMNVLMKKCGKDGFLYICPLGDTEDGLLGEDEDEEEEEYEDGDDEEDGDDSHVRDLRSAIFDPRSLRPVSRRGAGGP